MKRIESVLGQIRAADDAQENKWQEVVAREKYRKIVQWNYRQRLAKSVIKATINSADLTNDHLQEFYL
jgi:hypothetical protein